MRKQILTEIVVVGTLLLSGAVDGTAAAQEADPVCDAIGGAEPAPIAQAVGCAEGAPPPERTETPPQPAPEPEASQTPPDASDMDQSQLPEPFSETGAEFPMPLVPLPEQPTIAAPLAKAVETTAAQSPVVAVAQLDSTLEDSEAAEAMLAIIGLGATGMALAVAIRRARDLVQPSLG